MNNAGLAWRARAEELAEFTLLHLVNRTDVWGAYLPRRRRIRLEDGTEQKTWTAPAKRRRGVETLTLPVLARHYAGADVGDVIGLHSTSPANTSRFLAFDFDNHEGTTEKAAANRDAAERLCDVLRAFGLSPLIEISDDRGGLHVWIIFHVPAPTRTVHAFAVTTVAEMELTCETFPKQARVPRIGNWLRLPGLHHTRAHWSRFFVNGAEYAGEDAVETWFCAWLSDHAHLPVPPETIAVVVPILPRIQRRDATEIDRRVRGAIAKLPSGLGAGEGRNNAGYWLACFCVRDLALSDDVALAWLAEWNASNRTPMNATKLRSLIGEAHEYGQHAYGAAG